MEELKNKKILGVEVSKGEHYIRFTIDGLPPIIYEAEGDCCSESWFADIIGIHNLIGSTVRKVETVILPEPKDARTREDVDEAYGYKFTTGLGVSEIIYRNSSNGYYGGSLGLVDCFEEGTEWKNVITDFSF